MKLFTKSIEQQLQENFKKISIDGIDYGTLNVICKIFHPYTSLTWYIISQDPEDTDYMWCIAKGHEVEYGSVLKSQLETLIIKSCPCERDLGFRPEISDNIFKLLKSGKHI